MLECVVNVSEGRDRGFLDGLRALVEPSLLDIHSDAHHNRSVVTLVGEEAPREVARSCVAALDLSAHSGVHPRLGVVDVVPFVPLAGSTLDDALAARDRFAAWVARELGVPAFLYGPRRSLPEVRRGAWTAFGPDAGGPAPHPRAGATCVGARDVLVAYNVWLTDIDLAGTREICTRVRRAGIRTLAFGIAGLTQVSMNLVDPAEVTPADAYDAVTGELGGTAARIVRAELVGLVPESVLRSVPRRRWGELDLSADRTIEARLEARGISR